MCRISSRSLVRPCIEPGTPYFRVIPAREPTPRWKDLVPVDYTVDKTFSHLDRPSCINMRWGNADEVQLKLVAQRTPSAQVRFLLLTILTYLSFHNNPKFPLLIEKSLKFNISRFTGVRKGNNYKSVT
jgi:hypothetical protein